MFDSKPRAILLDAGFTLTFCHGGRIAELAAAAGVKVRAASLETAEPALRREIAGYVWAATVAQESASTRSAGPAFFRRLLDLAGAVEQWADTPTDTPASLPARLDAAAGAIWAGHLKRNVWSRIGEGVDDALARLRDAGIKLAIVSNSEGTVEAMLEEVGLRRHFDTVVDSWVVGVAKPDPRIFHLALDRLGVGPAEAIMVGDTPDKDIAGAQAAGTAAVLIDPLDLHALHALAEVPRFTDVPAFVDDLLGRR